MCHADERHFIFLYCRRDKSVLQNRRDPTHKNWYKLSVYQASVGNLNSCNHDLHASQSDGGGGLLYPQDGFKACILFPFVLVP